IFVRGMRNLSLSDRKDVPKGWISDETLPNANVILTHDHPYVDISIDEFRGILDDIDAVAEAIETDRVPRLLAGGTTPPPIDKGIYANWAFIGLIVIGLPACICVWGVLLTFLDSY
ncbi:MAG TPA: hypothetical protein DCX53_04730, partial [Anaerolineae bacterium]|nr:hypothetical protein [Anaerolineae bacterium]